MSNVNLTAAMRANLLSLQQTAQMQSQTQQRLATGLKVNSALDNPASYFAAAGYNQRASELGSLKDNIGEVTQMINAANNGVTGMQSLIANLQGQLTQASAAQGSATSGTLLTAVADSMTTILKQMTQLASDSSYKGVNFLNGTSTQITVNFNETATTSLTITGFDSTMSSTGLLSGFTTTYSSDTNASTVQGYLAGGSITSGDLTSTAVISTFNNALNYALASLQSDSTNLSSNLSILQTRQSFMSSMINTLQNGASNLISADTNQEGANMLMLQTRQQLGVTSLSLASQAAQSVLRLF